MNYRNTSLTAAKAYASTGLKSLQKGNQLSLKQQGLLPQASPQPVQQVLSDSTSTVEKSYNDFMLQAQLLDTNLDETLTDLDAEFREVVYPFTDKSKKKNHNAAFEGVYGSGMYGGGIYDTYTDDKLRDLVDEYDLFVDDTDSREELIKALETYDGITGSRKADDYKAKLIADCKALGISADNRNTVATLERKLYEYAMKTAKGFDSDSSNKGNNSDEDEDEEEPDPDDRQLQLEYLANVREMRNMMANKLTEDAKRREDEENEDESYTTDLRNRDLSTI